MFAVYRPSQTITGRIEITEERPRASMEALNIGVLGRDMFKNFGREREREKPFVVCWIHRYDGLCFLRESFQGTKMNEIERGEGRRG